MEHRDQIVDKRVIEREIRRGALNGQELTDHLAAHLENTPRSEWVTVTVEGRRTPTTPSGKNDS